MQMRVEIASLAHTHFSSSFITIITLHGNLEQLRCLNFVDQRLKYHISLYIYIYIYIYIYDKMYDVV